eukprot:COSAG06_NODE_636_length_13549_cov_8.611445_4_plen_86_part_00
MPVSIQQARHAVLAPLVELTMIMNQRCVDHFTALQTVATLNQRWLCWCDGVLLCLDGVSGLWSRSIRPDGQCEFLSGLYPGLGGY